MAVVKQPYACSIKLKYQSGVNASGDPVYVTRTYTKVKLGATDQDIYDVALALNGLQNNSLAGLFRVEDAELVNQ